MATNEYQTSSSSVPIQPPASTSDAVAPSIVPEVKIAVKDNGKGISQENAARIFEPKFTTKSSGMGLGLAIIKNIIENYNGTITFETELNIGTEFLVSFPINKQ